MDNENLVKRGYLMIAIPSSGLFRFKPNRSKVSSLLKLDDRYKFPFNYN